MLDVLQSFCQALRTPCQQVSKTELAVVNLADLRMCHPCNFRCKPFDMGFLSLKNFFRHEQGKCAIPDSDFLNPKIKPVADLLPDEPRRGLEAISEYL